MTQVKPCANDANIQITCQKHSLITNNSIINHIQISLFHFYVTFVQMTIQKTLQRVK